MKQEKSVDTKLKDPEKFGELYEKHLPNMMRLTAIFVPDTDIAEQLVEDWSQELWEVLEEGDESVVPWIKLARDKLLAVCPKEQENDSLPGDNLGAALLSSKESDGYLADLVNGRKSEELKLNKTPMIQTIRKHLIELSSNYEEGAKEAEIIMLRFLVEMEVCDVAKVIHTDEFLVRSIQKQGLLHLRELGLEG